MKVTVDLLNEILGEQAIVAKSKEAWRRLEVLLSFYKSLFPRFRSEDNSLTQAIQAMEFMLNAEEYFTNVGSMRAKTFFNEHHADFIAHFNYSEIINSLRKGEAMIFIYSDCSTSKIKLDANGVIGMFHSIEQMNRLNDPFINCFKRPKEMATVIKLQVSNKNVIELPVADMAYFGKWDKKLSFVI